MQQQFYLEGSHGNHHTLLHVLTAAQVLVLRQKVMRYSHQGVPRPALEPVHGAARDQTWELFGSKVRVRLVACTVTQASQLSWAHLQGTSAKLLPDRREAEDHMEVAPHSGQEEVVEVLCSGGSSRVLTLHDGNQVLDDVIQLVTGEQVGDLTARQHVVHVLCGAEVKVQDIWSQTQKTALTSGWVSYRGRLRL